MRLCLRYASRGFLSYGTYAYSLAYRFGNPINMTSTSKENSEYLLNYIKRKA